MVKDTMFHSTCKSCVPLQTVLDVVNSCQQGAHRLQMPIVTTGAWTICEDKSISLVRVDMLQS